MLAQATTCTRPLYNKHIARPLLIKHFQLLHLPQLNGTSMHLYISSPLTEPLVSSYSILTPQPHARVYSMYDTDLPQMYIIHFVQRPSVPGESSARSVTYPRRMLKLHKGDGGRSGVAHKKARTRAACFFVTSIQNSELRRVKGDNRAVRERTTRCENSRQTRVIMADRQLQRSDEFFLCLCASRL